MKSSSICNEDYRYIFNAILDMCDDGFLLIDSNGIVVDINNPYATFLGKSRNNLIGKNVTEIISNTEMIDIIKHERRDLNFISVIDQLEITPKSKDKISSITRSVVKNDENKIIGAVAQTKFREQILKCSESVNEFYKVLSSYDEQIVDKIKSKKEILDESNQIKKLQLQIEYYKNELQEKLNSKPVNAIGTSPNYINVKNKALRAAKNSFPVLITGETGTGKEVMADLIHCSSDRANNAFVKINCAAIPSELFESELFGYEKGAFTGSQQSGKKGKFILANKGTIFLDEIGDLPLNMQTKLLRVLQDGIIEPLGSVKPIPVDIRVISATNKNLEDLIRKNRFREDLYYRLNVIKLELPRLSDRKSDIMLISQYILNLLNWEYKTSMIFSPDISKYFENYNWPGNIRELNNVIKTAYALLEGNVIEPSHLPEHITINLRPDNIPIYQSYNKTLSEYLDYCERKFILDTLKNNKGNITKTASALGIHRSNLYTKIKKHNIENETKITEEFL